MTDISTGGLDPENRDADRDALPMTQVDQDEVDKRRAAASRDDSPSGEGTGIAGEPTRPPADQPVGGSDS